ncbi:MAG: polyprenyl synthetase family protein [Deltaproteobacteria bacterium]|nr:MAG: polyprenyl synthetase family protein [Deltaproteobacteria bacterium]
MSTSMLDGQPHGTVRTAAPPSPLESARRLVADDLAAVERRLAELIDSEVEAIPQVVGHLAFAAGKRFRPLVALLAAAATGFEDDARCTVAAVGELLHTATLLHDDVVDGGAFRRGRPASRVVFGNGMAVLSGDFCLARALQAMAALGRIEAMRTMADMVARMAEGEVAQLAMAGSFDVDVRRYYTVIDRKTAALIAWCSQLAGLVDPAFCEALDVYGLELGYAFQIADDVLDFASGVAVTGKARGQDFRDGKMTLPLLLACREDPALARTVERTLAGVPPVQDEVAEEVVSAVAGSRALDRARAIAGEHAERAVHALAALPASAARSALEDLADYVVRRRT